MTDTTTFTAEERRAEVDAWLYETCTQCLQHMVDIVALFYKPVAHILPRIFDLLSNFIRSCSCKHPSFPMHLPAAADELAESHPWCASRVHEDGVIANVAHAKCGVHVQYPCSDQVVSNDFNAIGCPAGGRTSPWRQWAWQRWSGSLWQLANA